MVDLPRRITEKDHVIAAKFKALWAQKQKELELTQAKAAEELNVTQSAFSQMLHCKVAIPTEMILKIAMLFSESPTKIDKDFYKRFDIKSSKGLKKFLALELSKLSASDQADLMEFANVRTKKAKKERTGTG